MPIFGNNGTPDGFYSAIENIINFGKFGMGAKSGWAESISLYLDPLAIGPAVAKVKCALYRACDHSLVGVTEERSFDMPTMPDGWQTFFFPCPAPLLGSADYLIAVWCASMAGNIRVRFVGSGGHGFHLRESSPYAEWPNPVATEEQTPTGNLFVYCTYVENA